MCIAGGFCLMQKSNKKPRYRLDKRSGQARKTRKPGFAYLHSVTLAARRSLLFGVTDKGYYTSPFPVCQPLIKTFLKVFSRFAFASTGKALHLLNIQSREFVPELSNLFAARVCFTAVCSTGCHYTRRFRVCQQGERKTFFVDFSETVTGALARRREVL